MNYLIECNSKFNSFSLSDQMEFEKKNHNYITKIRCIIKKIKGLSKAEFQNLEKEIKIIEEKISLWKYSKGEKVSNFEWIILISIVFSLIFLCFQISIDSFIFKLVKIIFSSSLIISLLAIRDYDLRKPRHITKFIFLSQRVSSLFSYYPFVPKEIYESLDITKKMIQKDRKNCYIRTKNDNGEYVEVEIKTKFNYYAFLTFSLFSITIFILITAFIIKFK